MTVVSTPRTGLPYGRELTVDDLELMPDDSYWLVDPDPDSPSLTALDLVDGRYFEMAVVAGAQSGTAERRYPVAVVPVDLLCALTPTGWREFGQAWSVLPDPEGNEFCVAHEPLQ